jgi:hypothetical protein
MPRRRMTRDERAAIAGLALLIYAIFLIPAALAYYVWRWIFASSRRFRFETLNELLELSPTEFEDAVARLLGEIGYTGIRRVGGPGDLAADVYCRDSSGRSVVVQCKRFNIGAKVGSPEVQKFIGMVHVQHCADGGIFVTTSSFTRPALDLGKRHRLRMIDGAELSRLIERLHNERQRLEAEQQQKPFIFRLSELFPVRDFRNLCRQFLMDI